jgi:hypothetical protein
MNTDDTDKTTFTTEDTKEHRGGPEEASLFSPRLRGELFFLIRDPPR